MVKVAIVQYPGSNCDLDALEILVKIEKTKTDLVWHKALSKENYDAYILPGGFSYGDYLRAGAIAATSPSIETIRKAVDNDKPVLGICNGFQTLVEAGILPGAILRNTGLRFICAWTNLRVERTDTRFTSKMEKGQLLKIPIAHNEGRYYLDNNELAELEKNGQVVFRYTSETGEIVPNANPNGSVNNIAGIMNSTGNVVGLMPHPERSSMRISSLDGKPYGRLIFDSMLSSLRHLHPNNVEHGK
jgi:phosphoribosylformylglycinamidine synthase